MEVSLPSFIKKCRVGQGVKTPPFHGACLRDAVRQGITGSKKLFIYSQMVIIYVLKSLVITKFYVGMTEDLTHRLKEHNAGRSRFTSAYKPWKIIYTEQAGNFPEGRIRGKYLKTAAGKKFILKQLSLPTS